MPGWRVIQVDNFDRDTVDDRVIEDGLSFQEAHDLAREKNAESPLDGLWFYRAVPDSAELEERRLELMRHQLTEGECGTPFSCRTCRRLEEQIEEARDG